MRLAAGRVAAGLVGSGLVLRWSWSASDLGDPGRRWAAVAVVALGVVLAVALPELRRLLPRPADVPLVLVVVLLATFLCVPETDQVLPVAVVAAALTLTEGLTRRRAPLVVVALVAGIVAWAGIFGATGRQSALVGALFAWWPVLILPLLAVWRPAVRSAPVPVRVAVVVVGAVAALAVARTGALAAAVAPAVVAVAIALPASLAAAAAIVVVAVRSDRDTAGRPAA